MRRYFSYLIFLILFFVLSILYTGNDNITLANIGYNYPDYSSSIVDSFKINGCIQNIYFSDVLDEMFSNNNFQEIQSIKEGFEEAKNRVYKRKLLYEIYNLNDKNQQKIRKTALWNVYPSIYLTKDLFDKFPKREDKSKITEFVYSAVIAKINNKNIFDKVCKVIDINLEHPKIEKIKEELSKYTTFKEIGVSRDEVNHINKKNLDSILDSSYSDLESKTIKQVIQENHSHSSNLVKISENYFFIYFEKKIQENDDIEHRWRGSYIDYIGMYIEENKRKGIVRIDFSPTSFQQCKANPNKIILTANKSFIHEDLPDSFTCKDFIEFCKIFGFNDIEQAINFVVWTYVASIVAKDLGFHQTPMFKQKYLYFRAKEGFNIIKDSIKDSKFFTNKAKKSAKTLNKMYVISEYKINSRYKLFWMVNAAKNLPINDINDFIKQYIDDYNKDVSKKNSFYNVQSLSSNYIIFDINSNKIDPEKLKKGEIYIAQKINNSSDILIIFVQDIKDDYESIYKSICDSNNIIDDTINDIVKNYTK